MPAKPPRLKSPTASSAETAAAPQRIVAGARRYFFAHGFRGVTMDDLAAELGMSKKTLYAHFPSKMELLQAVILDKMSSVEAGLQRAMSESQGDFSARLEAMLFCVRSHTEEIGEPYLRDVRREAPELFALIQQRRREHIQRYFGRLLQEGRKAGMIRSDIPATMMIEMLLGTVDAIVNPAKLGELGTTPKAAFHHIITIFLEGVLIRKGRAK
jgi:AcrR family transcriptional regulator